jgi:hypothetical protein
MPKCLKGIAGLKIYGTVAAQYHSAMLKFHVAAQTLRTGNFILVIHPIVGVHQMQTVFFFVVGRREGKHFGMTAYNDRQDEGPNGPRLAADKTISVLFIFQPHSNCGLRTGFYACLYSNGKKIT